MELKIKTNQQTIEISTQCLPGPSFYQELRKPEQDPSQSVVSTLKDFFHDLMGLYRIILGLCAHHLMNK